MSKESHAVIAKDLTVALIHSNKWNFSAVEAANPAKKVAELYKEILKNLESTGGASVAK